MKQRLAWVVRGLVAVGGFALAGACSSGAIPSAGEETHVRTFTNGGFETGTAGATPPSWPVTLDLNPGVTIQTPQTYAGLGLTPAIMNHAAPVNLTKTMVSATGPLTQPDALLGTAAQLRWPRFGNQCALVNADGNNQNVNTMSQTMQIAAGDVDPSDNQIHVRLVVAPVLENPGHPANEQPYFFVQVTNVTQGNAVLYANFNFSNQTGVPWITENANGTTYVYTNWQLIDVSPGGTAINMGDMIDLQIIAAGCSLGGHMGQVYVDGVGSVIPGLFVSGKGPTQVNPGNNVTYSLTYGDGGATADAGVVITINTPPGTTFSSINAPGLICSTPLVGTGGLITCTVGTLAAGASGSISLTVNVPVTTTGTVTLGNYQISGTGVPPLLGNVVNTIVGCTADNQCPTGDWCNETLDACTPTVANGTPVPIDPGHMNPTLNGVCSAAAGALVCTSGVCDTADNDCGYKNGDGTCTAADGSVVCRSAVCDTDGKCGLANGDGPCAVATGPVVCRSGVCSVSGKCEPVGGCDVDADCTGGKWCDETTHACTPKLANGTAVPNDPAHTNPTLNGTCTAAAGTLVCVSGVCDTKDNECGYANGDGPCTAATGAVVCRTGACSVSGVCEPVGGCEVDADCGTGTWCLESIHTCTPKLANGVGVPSDPPHSNPTLNGTCTAAAGALVCVSGVCDTNDNECGYANGDGPCTALDGPADCRSGACSTDGKCEPLGGCEVDADCNPGQYCNTPTSACVAKVVNGQAVPTVAGHSPTLNGTCTAAAGTAACVSGVCDTKDNECGYANGDGPCNAADGLVDCRSGACSTTSTCEPMGGCNVDADCMTGNWCDETTHTCTADLAIGVGIPTDGAHTNPTLNGKCTTAAGALVCISGVCDTKDNECGYANGDGPCTVANGPVDCRSGLCSATAGVCISTTGCAVDADCTSSEYCDTPVATCVAKVANGQPVPTVTGHSPTLNGTCTATAGAAACASGVCDVNDNKCGYANGDGPCTATDGATDCRSATCSTNGTCEPAGGCNVDADCAKGKWCNETMHVCLAQLANGTPVPTDTSHTDPTLNGTCTTAAGTLVCVSGVCDVKDNKCGYANGDGPCTASDGTVDCRSTICATSGTSSGLCVACTESSQCPSGMAICDTTTNACVECTTSSQCPTDAPICQTSTGLCTNMCTTDADCGKTDWCDIASGSSGLCTPKIANGKPLPTEPSSVATCTAAVGKRVCISGVCDPKDNDCGPIPDAGAPDAGVPDAAMPDAAAGLLPLGASCTLAAECQSQFCSGGVCSETISSGAGVFCAVRDVGSSGESSGGLGMLGVMLGLVGVRIGRRRTRGSV